MPAYILWNLIDKKPLRHPKIGIWNTTDKSEAEDMLKDLYRYLECSNLGYMKDRFIISTIESVSTDL